MLLGCRRWTRTGGIARVTLMDTGDVLELWLLAGTRAGSATGSDASSRTRWRRFRR